MTPTVGSFGVALIFVLYAFSGWNAASYIAGEMEAPQRNLPRALVAGTAFIAAGATSTTVPIQIVSDTNVEPDEDFTLELSNPTNAVLLTSFVTVTIRDDGSLIFRCGFETGDLSAWSAAVP